MTSWNDICNLNPKRIELNALCKCTVEGMDKHGYALISFSEPGHKDSVVMRFAVAGDDVLAERLKPIVIEFTGLEILTMTDPKRLANAKVRDAMMVRAMNASYQSMGDRKP